MENLFPYSIEVQTQHPLVAKRGPVATKNDLINRNSWSHDGDVFYVYNGMLVSVLSSNDLWMLVDSSKILEPDFSGWKLIGSVGADIDGGHADEVYSPNQLIQCGDAYAHE